CLGGGLRANDRVAAGPILDQHRLPPILAHSLPDDPRDDVARPARRERHDDPYRPTRKAGGKVLGLGEERRANHHETSDDCRAEQGGSADPPAGVGAKMSRHPGSCACRYASSVHGVARSAAYLAKLLALAAVPIVFLLRSAKHETPPVRHQTDDTPRRSSQIPDCSAIQSYSPGSGSTSLWDRRRARGPDRQPWRVDRDHVDRYAFRR